MRKANRPGDMAFTRRPPLLRSRLEEADDHWVAAEYFKILQDPDRFARSLPWPPLNDFSHLQKTKKVLNSDRSAYVKLHGKIKALDEDIGRQETNLYAEEAAIRTLMESKLTEKRRQYEHKIGRMKTELSMNQGALKNLAHDIQGRTDELVSFTEGYVSENGIGYIVNWITQILRKRRGSSPRASPEASLEGFNPEQYAHGSILDSAPSDTLRAFCQTIRSPEPEEAPLDKSNGGKCPRDFRLLSSSAGKGMPNLDEDDESASEEEQPPPPKSVAEAAKAMARAHTAYQKESGYFDTLTPRKEGASMFSATTTSESGDESNSSDSEEGWGYDRGLDGSSSYDYSSTSSEDADSAAGAGRPERETGSAHGRRRRRGRQTGRVKRRAPVRNSKSVLKFGNGCLDTLGPYLGLYGATVPQNLLFLCRYCGKRITQAAVATYRMFLDSGHVNKDAEGNWKPIDNPDLPLAGNVPDLDDELFYFLRPEDFGFVGARVERIREYVSTEGKGGHPLAKVSSSSSSSSLSSESSESSDSLSDSESGAEADVVEAPPPTAAAKAAVQPSKSKRVPVPDNAFDDRTDEELVLLYEIVLECIEQECSCRCLACGSERGDCDHVNISSPCHSGFFPEGREEFKASYENLLVKIKAGNLEDSEWAFYEFRGESRKNLESDRPQLFVARTHHTVTDIRFREYINNIHNNKMKPRCPDCNFLELGSHTSFGFDHRCRSTGSDFDKDWKQVYQPARNVFAKRRKISLRVTRKRRGSEKRRPAPRTKKSKMHGTAVKIELLDPVKQEPQERALGLHIKEEPLELIQVKEEGAWFDMSYF